MEGINAGYNLYIECQKYGGGRPTILPSLSVEQYEEFVLSASQARKSRLEYIIDYPNQRYNTLLLCEVAALCPFYRPPALEHIQETPQDLTLWLEAIRNGNLDRMTYATLFRLLHLLLSDSESCKNILNLLDVQMSILQCCISRLDFTLPLLATTRMFIQHLMDKDPWHPMIGKLKMTNRRFSTMVPSLEEFEKSCVILHDVQNDMPLGNRYLPGSFSAAAEVLDANLEIPTSQLQAARNVLVWMETHIDWFRHLRPSLAIPTDLAEFQTYLTTPHAHIRTQYILHRLRDNERFHSREWLLLLHTLAALCPLWFPIVDTGGDLIRFLHAFRTNEMTPTSFKVLYQILSITTFHNPPPELAKDIQIIQKRLQWTAEGFEESLASAISYFQEMFLLQKSVEFQSRFYGMKAILAVKHQVKPVKPLKSIATLLRGIKILQEHEISNSSKGQELSSESLGTRFCFRPSASTRESISDNFSASHKEYLSVLPSPKSVTTRVESCDQMYTMAEQSIDESTVDTDCSPLVLIPTVDLPTSPISDDMASKVSLFRVNETQEPEKRHECDVCGHDFKRPTELQRHYRGHTEEKSHQCYCGKAFMRSDTLKRHQKVHEMKEGSQAESRKEQHECDVCGHSFKGLYELRRHYKGHTDEKTHQCYCGKAYMRADALKRHQKVHGKKDLGRTYKSPKRAALSRGPYGAKSESRSQAEKRKRFKTAAQPEKDEAALK